ncbi:carboxymuconolactone decarboxylase family protein [Natrinema salaciae]|uniref:Alkylhydroperoxidase AhpD family core domain-containing protein n=1 Tax=Natrinema salaciae TaxID=1186196 RepID=A0A1H9S979_9EURY|nr:carboxymuconolactone decarboxylase family protein [Natrinema salaciae]SER81596.1 alkylhydroperoxidase AhpD family core domain-containing protein [Natrinema salaciae]
MATKQTQQEMEEHLGQVPSWMEHLAEPASDHSWGIFRDLGLGETNLSKREKALVEVSAAAAMQCPYCTYFHKEEARLAEVSEDELEETINLAGVTRYFSTILHGNEVDHDEFVAETDEIVEYIEEQEAPTADD